MTNTITREQVEAAMDAYVETGSTTPAMEVSGMSRPSVIRIAQTLGLREKKPKVHRGLGHAKWVKRLTELEMRMSFPDAVCKVMSEFCGPSVSMDHQVGGGGSFHSRELPFERGKTPKR